VTCGLALRHLAHDYATGPRSVLDQRLERLLRRGHGLSDAIYASERLRLPLDGILLVVNCRIFSSSLHLAARLAVLEDDEPNA
jgi:hypothetical protein